MTIQPSRKVWRKDECYYTRIFISEVNWNCTSVTIDWPENNYRLTFIPSDDGWVILLFRGEINSDDSETKAENAGQISKSVYKGMADWALQVLTYHMFVGYRAEAEDPQLALF